MKILSILSLIFISSLSAAKSLEEKFMDPGVVYVTSGTTVATTAVNTAGKNMVTYNVSSNLGSIFNLNYLTISGNFDVASGSAAILGRCSLQVPTGTTVAQWPFVNSGTSGQTPVILSPAYPLPITGSFTVSCAPQTATQVDWFINYNGWQY